MAFTIDRLLYFPSEDFEYDTDSHIKNLRALRAYLETANDILPMLPKDTLPAAVDWPLGTLVVVTNATTGHPEAWINKVGGWFRLLDGQNTTIPDSRPPFSGASLECTGISNIANDGNYDTVVNWNGFQYESGHDYGPSGTDAFDIPVTGIYRLSLWMPISTNQLTFASNQVLEITIVKNYSISTGVLFFLYQKLATTHNISFVVFQGDKDVLLNAGDDIAMYVRQDGNPADSVFIDPRSTFSIELLKQA